MQKKLIHLIPAILICFCFSCNPQENTPRNYSSSASEYSEIFPNPTQPSPFWNTDDVDISDITPSKKLISLTFDDSPNRTLEGILAVYAAFNEENPDCPASATLFLNGGLIDGHSLHLLHAAVALGFELGNHTQNHQDLTTLSKEELRLEIFQTDEILSQIDGKPYHLLRAPFGRVNALVKEFSFTPIIDWTIDTLDWTGVSEEDIYSSIWNGRFSGAIVLLHDGYEHTMSALKRLLPDLKADGYQVVSVSKMAKAHGCTLQRGGRYIRARKQN